jgi:AraC family transcriptional regulator
MSDAAVRSRSSSEPAGTGRDWPPISAAALALQARFGPDRYRVSPPLLRSGVTVARLRTRSDDAAVDSAFTADGDIVSVHLAPLQARFWIDGRPKPLAVTPAGSTCLIGRGSPSRALIPGGADAIHVHIPRPALEAAAEDQLEWSHGAPLFLHIGERVRDPLLEQLARNMAAATEAGGAAERLYADTLTQALTAHLLRRYSNLSAPRRDDPVRGGLTPRRLRQVVEHMEASLDQNLVLADLAALAGLSVHHFCRAFKQSTGQPPHAWLSARRVERIKHLLADPQLSLTEIALRTGYSSQSAMGAAFRRATGDTPSTWRRSL